MTCREIIEHLIDYVDGPIAEDERAAFAYHFERCDSCRAYLDSYLKTIHLVRREF